MSSTNNSGRPSGSVSIPVEIIRDSNSTRPNSHSRHNSPFPSIFNDNPHGVFTDSPPWSSTSTSRFQPRHSPNTAYDRVITNSQFNQPLNDHSSYQQYQEPQNHHSQQRMYESNPPLLSRSHEDLLATPFDSIHYTSQPQYSSLIPPLFGSGFRNESDFVQPTNFSSPLRRSYDALNDFPDMHQSFPTTRQYPSEQSQPQHQQQQQQPPPQQQHQHQQQQQQQQQQPYYRSTYQTQHPPQSQQPPTYANQTYINPNIVYTNEYGIPTDHYQQNPFQGTGSNVASDRSRSPASQRGASPARPPPSTSQQQQPEPELKMAKDTDGPIPMPAPAASSSSHAAPPTQSAEPQVPPTDTGVTANNPSPPPEPARDPNTIALEKLDQIKQSLGSLEKEVDGFNGSTRHERAYKLLDEQGLKIMIRCDELVDVSPDIKEKRKEMIRNVQRVIGKLESKVPATPAVESNSNPMETAATSTNKSFVNHNAENHDKKSSSPTKENTSASTEQSIST